MNTINRLYWPIQIIGWFAYAFLLVIFTFLNKPEVISTLFFLKIVSNVLLTLSLTHLMRSVILKSNWLNLNLSSVLPRVLLLSVVVALILSLSTRAMSFFLNDIYESIDGGYSLSRFFVDWSANTILILFWNCIYFSYTFFGKIYFQQINNLEIEASMREVELKNLRNHLNPHFLFNSLNSIKALIEIDSAKAKESLTVLSNLLRGSLMIGQNGTISLSKEIEMVENYLKLEKIRFEERLIVKWAIPQNTDSIMFPPFLLQMLVENALKHGVAGLKEGGEINIIIKQNNRVFQLFM